MKATCKQCAIEFEYDWIGGRHKTYCSFKCARKAQNKRFYIKHKEVIKDEQGRLENNAEVI